MLADKSTSYSWQLESDGLHLSWEVIAAWILLFQLMEETLDAILSVFSVILVLNCYFFEGSPQICAVVALLFKECEFYFGLGQLLAHQFDWFVLVGVENLR